MHFLRLERPESNQERGRQIALFITHPRGPLALLCWIVGQLGDGREE